MCAAALALSNPLPASAQAADAKARQEQIFRELEKDPANLELMFAYAVASMQAEDYEPAISTLERMLFFNPDLARVKLELAVAYYRLGVYDVARFHFDSVLEGDPPQEVVDRIAPFIAQIEDRTAESAFSGFVEVGGVYSTNANFGPPDREVRAEFFPGGVGQISEDDDEADDFGARVKAVVSHRYDLRAANDNAWISSFSYTGVHYQEETAGDLDAVFVATGPRLAADDEAFGLKLRPYVGGSYVRSANESLYVAGSGGLEATETFTPLLSGFAAASLEWRDFLSGRDDFDGLYGVSFAGVSITPDRTQSYGVSFLAETDRAAEAFNSNHEFGLRLSASRLIDLSGESDLEVFARPWRLSVFGLASRRIFDEPDPAVDADKARRDTDVRFGGRLTAPLADDIAAAVDVSYYRRRSNIENFELRNFEVGLSLVHFF